MLLKLSKCHPSLHCRRNLGSRLPEQAHPDDSTGNTPESQCAFRSNRRIADMVFVLTQIQKKCREQNIGLYAAFIDLAILSVVMNCGKSWRAVAF